MSAEVAYECPECGAGVREEDTKCNSCGAVFEGDGGDSAVSPGDTAPAGPGAGRPVDGQGGPAEDSGGGVIDAKPITHSNGGIGREDGGDAEVVKEREESAKGIGETAKDREEAESADGGKGGGRPTEKAENEEDSGGGKKAEEEPVVASRKGPSSRHGKKAGPNKAGIAIAALGALGLAGAVLLDPILNLLDSKHPAGINIGTTQMAGLMAAVIVLAAGVVIALVMGRRK